MALCLAAPLSFPAPVRAVQVEGGSKIADIVADSDGDGRIDRAGSEVTVSGVLTSTFAVRGDLARAYLQDVSRGIGLWLGADEVARQAYRPGDLVSATGELIVWREGRPRLRVSTLRVLGSVPRPAPRDVAIADLADGQYWGMLLRLTGTLLYTPEGPAQALLEDATGRVPVFIPQELLLDSDFAHQVLAGRQASVTGFAEEFGDERLPGMDYSVSIDEQTDIGFAPPSPYRWMGPGLGALSVIGLILYLASRRVLAERRSRKMQRLVAHLQDTRATLEESESALRRSEAHYRSLVEHAPVGVLRCSVGGEILSANAALVETLGYASPGELVGRELGRHVYDEADDWLEMSASLTEGDISPSVETLWRRRDGSTARVQTRFRVVRGDAEGVTLQGLVEDTTERQHLEQRVRQGQKMEAVGQLAGGVAHDFNNLLTVILGSCQFLLETELDEASAEEVHEIRAAGRKAAALTHQLLAFSRRQPLAPEVLDPNTVVSDALKLLRRTVGEDVELTTSLRPLGRMVTVDRSQLEQVLMNLVVNARDAMATGGTVTIRTRRVVFDDAAVQVRPGATPGEYVALSVADTGAGMSLETQKRIFEPFFTTKEVGTGTGLGLATVYGIVKQSDGYIEVESEPGQGATFTAYLPVATGETAEDEAQDEAAGSPEGGSETILLVEDEEPLRIMARRVLMRAGYSLLEAADGEEAIRLADEYAGEIHALVTDVVMPRRSGRQVMEHLARTRGLMRVLYITGHTDDDVVRHGVFEAREALLRKPFTPDSLLYALRSLLDSNAPAGTPELAMAV